MIKTVLVLVVATTMATAQNIGDCQRDFRPTADADDCSALLQLARCFGVAGLDEMSDTSPTRQAAEQFMLAQQARQPGCAGAVDQTAPKIRTTRGDITYEVGEGADVRAFRFRRETVSLFDMSSRLEAVEERASTAEGAVQEVRSEMAAALSTQASTSASTLVALNAQVALAIANAATAAQQLSTATAAQVTTMNTALAAATASIGTEITAATSNITALQLRPSGKMIGHAQCEHRGANGADRPSTIVQSCTFRKTRSDTFWVISHYADTRQISGSSNWQIEVDSQPCRDRNNNVKGSIDAAFHGAGPNMHRPMYIRGICYRTVNQAVIPAGNHVVRWRQTRTSGDSYWGWESSSRIMVEEWLP